MCLFFFYQKKCDIGVDFYNIDEVIHFLYNKAYYDWIINYDVVSNLLRLAHFGYRIFDKGILEMLGPDGFSATAWNLIKNYKKLASGHPYNYVCLILIGLIYIYIIFKYFF